MLRIVPHTVPRVGRSYEHFPSGFELYLLRQPGDKEEEEELTEEEVVERIAEARVIFEQVP